jgi:hypothetical protein
MPVSIAPSLRVGVRSKECHEGLFTLPTMKVYPVRSAVRTIAATCRVRWCLNFGMSCEVSHVERRVGHFLAWHLARTCDRMLACDRCSLLWICECTRSEFDALDEHMGRKSQATSLVTVSRLPHAGFDSCRKWRCMGGSGISNSRLSITGVFMSLTAILVRFGRACHDVVVIDRHRESGPCSRL